MSVDALLPNFSYRVHDSLAAWLGGTPFPAAPTTLYAGLLTQAPSPDGTGIAEPASEAGYARQPVTLSRSHDAGETTLTNTSALAYGAATQNWTPVDHFGLFDQDGHLLLYGRLRTTRVNATGQVIVFQAGAISIALR